MSTRTAFASADRAIVVKVPLTIRRRCGRKRIEASAEPAPPTNAPPAPLVVALARAHRWQELLDTGAYGSISALAKAVGTDIAYVGRLLQLTLLAPDLIEAILAGREPSGLSLARLGWRLPLLWSDQRAVLADPASFGKPKEKQDG
jgi:hypothetical protein